MKTSGNAEIGLITAKDDNRCHTGGGEKIYFLLLVEERHKRRSSQSEADSSRLSLKVTHIHTSTDTQYNKK